METQLQYVEKMQKKALRRENLSKSEIIRLLEIKPHTPEWEALGKAARHVTSTLTGDRAYLWGAIGVDFAPCSMNCDFCSLGEKWGIVKEVRTYNEDETVRLVRHYAENGVRWIVLRTTEFFSQEQLGVMIHNIRGRVPGDYELCLNIGEFDKIQANWLSEQGVEFVYHSLRLREGQDTQFDPAERMATLNSVKESNLNLAFLVEPIGIEHTNEELADICILTRECGAKVGGAMARIPVEGTPLGGRPQVSDARVAQIIAVTRLACAGSIEHICVHPGTQIAMEFGANVTVVETGAIPRDRCCCSGGKWNGFDADKAKKLFFAAGYATPHDWRK